MRGVIAEYIAEDVYSAKRAEVQDKIRQRAESMLSEKMVTGGESEDQEENVLSFCLMPCSILSTCRLSALSCPRLWKPPSIAKSSNIIFRRNKFRVARQIRKLERKKIELKGSANSSRASTRAFPTPTCAGAASRRRFQLAQSSNSKIVIIGGGKEGLPIILRQVDASPSPAPQTPAGNEETAPKERTTAATRQPRWRKCPLLKLTKPVEKTPST